MGNYMDEVMIIEQLRRQNEALTYEIEAMKYNLTEDLLCAEEEIAAMRNPWIKTSDALPRLEEFVLAIDSCDERFLVQLFSDGSWMDEYDTLFLNMSYWMYVPAPNEVK